MSERIRTRCPYTLKPLVDLPKVNDEHILPDSIGGSYDYSVRADEATNSTLGSTVDAAFVNSPLVAMMRTQHGVKSRSGMADWTVKGETKDGGHPVEVTIPHDGKVDLHFRKPVVVNDSGTGANVVVLADERDDFIATITKNMAKKGKKVLVANDRRTESQEIDIHTTIDFQKVWVGLTKIAYLAAFEFLGDDFLDDPLNPEWQKGVRATTGAEFEKVEIRTLAAEGVHKVTLPTLADHEHAVSVCNLRQTGPLVTVRLFNSDLLTMVLLASNSTNFGLAELEGRVVVCDSLTKKIRVQSFQEHFLKMSNQQSQGGRMTPTKHTPEDKPPLVAVIPG